MFDDYSGQELGIGSARRSISIVEVGFTSNTSNHHRLHIHEPGPLMPDNVNQTSDMRASPRQNVLVENEKWLDGPNLPL